jgi:mitochondrial intermembrane space import and assembly protein 40
MKGGGCREVFVAWEKCVDGARDSGENFATKCMELTSSLHKCMEKAENRDYYMPMLEDEEKYAQEQAEKREAEAVDAAGGAADAGSPPAGSK